VAVIPPNSTLSQYTANLSVG